MLHIFPYENPNLTTVYVPIGSDNNIIALGSYSGVQPQIFLPSGGKFDVYFDGQKLTWLLITYNGNQKTAIASDASSTSADVAAISCIVQLMLIQFCRQMNQVK